MNFSWTEIIAVATASVASIVAAVPVFNFIAARIDQRRKDKKESQSQHLSLTAEIAKIKAERDEHERDELKELYEIYKSRCEECEKKLEIAESSSLISRQKKREVNAVMLKINKNLYSMRKGFEEKYHIIELAAIFDHIEKQFEELENILP